MPGSSFNERTIAEFRAHGGRVGGAFEGFPLLLLTSTGRRSGAERVNPVARFDIDGRVYVVGSAAGRPEVPAWVLNIQADPHVEVEIGDRPKTPATARELPGEERDRIFDIVKQRAPGFAGYERNTSGIRVIPVFELILSGAD